MRSFLRRLRPPEGDLLHDAAYLRLWSSILTSAFGNQVMMLALPLTAAVLLHATPTQMGVLTAIELAPFILVSLPAGVWLDRVRKLPVYVVGESMVALAAASVPLAWWLGWLSMSWLYVVGFLLGLVHTVAGTAAQIVLTQVVPRSRLVEAHAKNALATSGAEVAGPGLAGALIKLFDAPLALLVNAALLLSSALILRGLPNLEPPAARSDAHFGRDLMAGLRFVIGQRLLLTLAALMGVWQMCHYAVMTVQILFATRILGLSEQGVGLCYAGMGFGTIVGSVTGNRISRRLGPGPCLVVGYAICGAGWLLLAAAPANGFGVAAFALMLMSFTAGAVFIFINFLALRQSVTPQPLLGRMTATMRWLTLLAAAPGALLGGWLGEHVGLRAALLFAGGVSVVLVVVAWRLPMIRNLRALPTPDFGADGSVSGVALAPDPTVAPGLTTAALESPATHPSGPTPGRDDRPRQ